MAKYDWQNLEKEYILGDYKSVSAFLKEKNIPNNGSTKKSTKGWKEKKVLKENQKSSKTIEKVIEKEAEKEAEKIVTVNDVAKQLLKKISKISSKEEINEWSIKKITSSLKDLNDILNTKDPEQNNDGKINELIGALNEYKKNR